MTFYAVVLASAALLAPISEYEAQEAHRLGKCGTLGPGTGLTQAGNGYVVSMVPGKHEFRISGIGKVVPEMRDMDIGRPYSIECVGCTNKTWIEWKVPGREWGIVPKAFLYKPTDNPYDRNTR